MRDHRETIALIIRDKTIKEGMNNGDHMDNTDN